MLPILLRTDPTSARPTDVLSENHERARERSGPVLLSDEGSSTLQPPCRDEGWTEDGQTLDSCSAAARRGIGAHLLIIPDSLLLLAVLLIQRVVLDRVPGLWRRISSASRAGIPACPLFFSAWSSCSLCWPPSQETLRQASGWLAGDDQDFIRRSILEQWRERKQGSPSLGLSASQIYIYKSDAQDERDVQGIFGCLIGAAVLSGRTRAVPA